MNNEIKTINPTELIVQEGQDKGRIDEVDLAEVGAIAENESRDRSNGFEFGKDTEAKVGNYEAEKAMRMEIGNRAVKFSNVGIPLETVNMVSEQATDNFSTQQKIKEEERKVEESANYKAFK